MRHLVGLVVVGAMLLAGCGRGTPAPPNASPEGDGDASHLTLVGQPTPADVALQFSINTGMCAGDDPPTLGKVDVDEQKDTITVTARLATTAPRSGSGGCADLGGIVRAPVALAAPLGSRRLLDGSCTPPADVLREGEAREACAPTAQQKSEEGAIGVWHKFDRGPLSPRGEPHAVWTGKEMIVVGGLAIEAYRSLSDGAAYDPVKNSWRRIAELPQPGRVRAVVWTGTKVMALSQATTDVSLTDVGVVHLYDPVEDAWRKAASPPHAFTDPLAFWTGGEVIVWAGNGGALYNPSTDTWRDIPAVDVTGAAAGTRAHWIAEPGVLAVQGDYDARDGSARRSALLLFDPSANTWRKAADPPGTISGFAGAAVVGQVAVFDSYEPAGDGSALAYDAERNTWRKIDSAPSDRDAGTAYFTGVDLGDNRGVVRVGSTTKPLGIVDLTSGKWSHAASPGRLPAPDGVLVWTGHDVLLWGQGSPVAHGDLNEAWKWSPP